MARTNKEFSDEQWRFLNVLYVLSGPVPVQVAGVLAPLLPGPLFELIDQGRAAGWLRQDESNRFSLTEELPENMKQVLSKGGSQRSLNRLLQKIYSEKLDEKLEPKAMLALLNKAGRTREAAEYEIRLAHDALENHDYETTRAYLQAAAEHLYPICFDKGVDSLFLSTVLELSNILFSLGYGFGDIEKYLVKANEVSKEMGNQRAHALINLHLGRLFYFSNRRDEALIALSMGFEEISEIGDNDILDQSAMFFGLYYFIKGFHREAIEHFEKAEKAFETSRYGELTHPIAPFLTGYCALYLGQFHRAIGNLDYQWRSARDRSNIALASTIRATLGTALVFMRKKKEGLLYLQQAIEEASEYKNSLGVYLGRGGLSLYYFLEGHPDEAYQISRISREVGMQAGIIRQYASPWVLDMHYEYLRLGFEPLPQIDLWDEIEHTINGINVHLQGVALRLRAREKTNLGENMNSIKADLDKSIQCLEQSGDPIELSKTILEKTRLELKLGNREEAGQLAEKARHLLEGYAEEFFPDEFRHLIEKEEITPDTDAKNRHYLQRYLRMVESLYPIESRHEILTKVLTQMNRMFGAERSALFWFPSGKESAGPELRATCNLSGTEVESGSFKRSLDMVVKAFKTNQPQLGRLSEKESSSEYPKVKSTLCIPVEVGGSVKGVMYFDNSYLPDAFDFLDPEIMRDIVRHSNLVIERRFNYLQIEEERNILDSIKSLDYDRNRVEIIAKSENMARTFKLAEQVAKTESSVLILGETGTGKELLARWIHRNSQRSGKPFIIVDAATIPESLLESELFGYERGAFTGADRRKIGRVEMADKGTLFLDEVGELPLSAQVKLLRAIQEKEFNRVGGTRTIHSDFRLVTATNRVLEKEVAEGRFREDLYYRLNVIPIHLPPLRERIEDIPLMASYFMNYYAKIYKRQDLNLTKPQEKTLCRYSWPGNVRELKNIIERAVLLSADSALEFTLPAEIQKSSQHPFEDYPTLEDVQRRYIEFVIRKTGGQIGGAGGAAEILGMNRTSVYSRMRQLKIGVKSVREKATAVTPLA